MEIIRQELNTQLEDKEKEISNFKEEICAHKKEISSLKERLNTQPQVLTCGTSNVAREIGNIVHKYGYFSNAVVFH